MRPFTGALCGAVPWDRQGRRHPSLECTVGALLGPWGQSPGLRPCPRGKQQRHLTPQKGQVGYQVFSMFSFVVPKSPLGLV